MIDPDIRFMKMALGIGSRGQGRTWPNPSVGCVIVKDGQIIGRGVTADGGRPHAEVVALAQAGAGAKGATVYVTLEPCSHHGKSGPCSEALINSGVTRVVVACSDPNPEINGNGLMRLAAAGIEVRSGVLEHEAHISHQGFFKNITQERPFVTLKLASTLDGRIATASGESRWITGPAARRVVHAMRMRHDAVLVGGGTARADDPTLTVREMGVDRQPVRIVAARNLNLPWPARLADTTGEGPIWLLCAANAPEKQKKLWQTVGAEILEVSVAGAQLEPAAMMRALATKGLTRVFCEGGGALAASLLAAGQVDEVVQFSAGKMLGAEGWPAVGAMGISALEDAPKLQLIEQVEIGEDVMTRWKVGG